MRTVDDYECQNHARGEAPHCPGCCDETIRELRDRLAALREPDERDAVYRERDRLVCALSKLFPASLERHPDEDREWEDDWRWIVFVDLPTGQATWHIHDSELAWFDHLARNTGRKWDGHTTDEKYERLAAIRKARGTP